MDKYLSFFQKFKIKLKKKRKKNKK